MQDNSNEWYRERDKRTDGCKQVTGEYKTATVCVYVTQDLNEHRVQLLTYFSIIMLAKWCRSINLVVNDAGCLLENSKENFSSFIITKAKTIDPYCAFTINSEEQINSSLDLYIGEKLEAKTGNYITINGAGWQSACGFNKAATLSITRNGPDVLGACFAACLGNAAMFRFLNGIKESPFCKWYCLFNAEVYDRPGEMQHNIPFSAPLLGRLHLIGCGAIGSSFISLFPYLDPASMLLLVDPDEIKLHNTSSSLLFTYEDAKEKRKKVDVCNEYLAGFGIASEMYKNDYANYNYQYSHAGLHTPDIVLCFANENNIWSTIQNQYPPVSFHATTSKSWGIHVGRHIPLRENCLVCTFKNFIDTNFTPVCGEVKMVAKDRENESEEGGHTAILPFLAPAAACICLAEVLKFSNGTYQSNNNITFNMSMAEAVFLQDHESFGNCFTCTQQAAIYPQLGPFSKFWDASVA